MTRHESNKEDLIADAVALVDRAEYSLIESNLLTASHSQAPVIVTVGFRNDRSLSVYFDQDPFYQFDAEGLLRRSFSDGYLFRSQGTTLAKLQRTRTTEQVTLQRNDLPVIELEDFRNRMRHLIENFRNAVQNGSARRMRTVTDLANFDKVLLHHIDLILAHSTAFLSNTINHRK